MDAPQVPEHEGGPVLPGYQKLLALANDLLQRARQLLRTVGFSPNQPAFTLDQVKSGLAPVTTLEEEILHYVILTETVCDNARRRVLQGLPGW